MKANVRYGVLAVLWIAACNRPDAALFDDVPPSETKDETSVGGSAAGSATSAGSATESGGSAAASANGGSAPSAGGPVDTGEAGNPSTPDGMAGAPDAVAGSSSGTGGTGEPPKPPEPVCGNGKLEAGEECDDSGKAGKDGCEACKVVCADFGAGTLKSEDHHCYNGYDAATFEGSIEACTKRGAHLATISSEAENKIALKFVNNSKWLGGLEDVAQNVEGTGAYTWLTGEPFSYTNWGKEEPDQARARCEGGGFGSAAYCYQHCISLLGDGTWADERCDISDGYVCEWEPAGTK